MPASRDGNKGYGELVYGPFSSLLQFLYGTTVDVLFTSLCWISCSSRPAHTRFLLIFIIRLSAFRTQTKTFADSDGWLAGSLDHLLIVCKHREWRIELNRRARTFAPSELSELSSRNQISEISDLLGVVYEFTLRYRWIEFFFPRLCLRWFFNTIKLRFISIIRQPQKPTCAVRLWLARKTITKSIYEQTSNPSLVAWFMSGTFFLPSRAESCARVSFPSRSQVTSVWCKKS